MRKWVNSLRDQMKLLQMVQAGGQASRLSEWRPTSRRIDEGERSDDGRPRSTASPLRLFSIDCEAMSTSGRSPSLHMTSHDFLRRAFGEWKRDNTARGILLSLSFSCYLHSNGHAVHLSSLLHLSFSPLSSLYGLRLSFSYQNRRGNDTDDRSDEWNRSGKNVFTQPAPIDLSNARNYSFSLDLDLDDEEAILQERRANGGDLEANRSIAKASSSNENRNKNKDNGPGREGEGRPFLIDSDDEEETR